MSADEVYDRATWRRVPSYIDPTYSGNKMKKKKKSTLLRCLTSGVRKLVRSVNCLFTSNKASACSAALVPPSPPVFLACNTHTFDIHSTYIRHTFDIHSTYIRHTFDIHSTYIRHTFDIRKGRIRLDTWDNGCLEVSVLIERTVVSDSVR